MFGLQILDIILGLVFVYFMLSIVCSAANEVVSQWFNWRAETLRDGIRVLLTGVPNPPDPTTAAKAEAKAKQDEATAAADLRAMAPEQFAVYEAAKADAEAAEEAARSAETREQEARRERDRLEAALVLARRYNPASVPTALEHYEQARQEADSASQLLMQMRQRSAEAKASMERAIAAIPEEAAEPRKAWQEARTRHDQARASYLAAGLYAHPLIIGLSQSKWVFKPLRRAGHFEKIQLPSYIPAPTFATALLDLIAPVGPGGSASIAEIRRTVLELPDQMARPLLIFLDEAGHDLERVRVSIAKWYEDAMVRVSGLYKRKTQWMILLIAMIVTVVVHADSIRIARALASDATLRQALVAQAEALANDPSADIRELTALDSMRRAEARRRQAAAGTARAEDPGPGSPAPAAQNGDTAASGDTVPRDTAVRLREDSIAAFRLRQIRTTVDSLQAIGVPLGWAAPDAAQQRRFGGENGKIEGVEWVGFYVVGALRSLPGLLITVLAVSLGAPFWFDMLNKIVNIRAAGRAPEEKPKPPEEQPPARGARA